MTAPRYPTLIPVPAEIRSARLLLRPLREADAGQLLAAIEESRGHLAPWLLWPPNIQHLDDARDLCIRWAAKWTLRTDLGFGIFSTDDGRFLGAIGLHDPNWDLPAFEIGYWLRTSAVGAGYVTEAVQLLIIVAFELLGAQRVDIRCDPNNLHSRRVPERLGIPLEGHLHNAWLDPLGNMRDTLVFAATPEEYRRLQENWRPTLEQLEPRQPEGLHVTTQSALLVRFSADGSARQSSTGACAMRVPVRQATIDDAAIVARLMNQFDGTSATPEQVANRMKACASFLRIYLGFLNDVEAGFACLRLLPNLQGDELCAELTELYVDPPFRRHGVARALLEHISGVARVAGALEILLNTDFTNVAAQAAYRAAGYADYALSMRKRLPDAEWLGPALPGE